MAVGFQAFNDSNTVQITQDSFCLSYHSKGRQTLNAKNNYQFSGLSATVISGTEHIWQNSDGTGRPPGFGGSSGLLAFRTANGQPVGIGWRSDGSLGFLGFNNTGTAPVVDWWYFTRPQPREHGEGLEIYDGNGQVTYTTANKVMQVVAVANDVTGGVSAPYGGDWAISVGSPLPTVDYYEYNDQFNYRERGLVWSYDGQSFPSSAIVLGARQSSNSAPFTNGRQPKATQLVINVAGL